MEMIELGETLWLSSMGVSKIARAFFKKYSKIQYFDVFDELVETQITEMKFAIRAEIRSND